MITWLVASFKIIGRDSERMNSHHSHLESPTRRLVTHTPVSDGAELLHKEEVFPVFIERCIFGTNIIMPN